MKYAVVIFVCCVLALATAAPQLFLPGLAAYGAPYSRTVVAGPTVYNGAYGARLVAPGYVGPAFF